MTDVIEVNDEIFN